MNCGHILRKTGRFSPRNQAVWFEDDELTYGQLYERSCRLVNALLGLGLRPRDPVATLGPNALRSLEEITGLALGGFVRVPLSYRNGVDLHRFMLEHVGARALIVDQERYEQLRGHLDGLGDLEHVIVAGEDGPVVYDDVLAAASPEDAEILVAPEDAIHVAFTGGTTGRPKATVQTHQSWLSVTAENMIMMRPLTEQDRYLAAGPLSHAASTVIFALVAKGAGNVVMPAFAPSRAAELIERHRVTFTVMVPTMLQLLVDDPETAKRDLSSLRMVLATGAPISDRTIRDVRAALGDVLYLGYGQSEGIPGTILTPEEIARGLDEDPTLLRSAGRPAPRSMIRILDDDGRELPPGERGEIAIDTPGNMKELWGDPEATAKRFTPDGFILTRDIGYLDERGYLFLADRKEDVIISGGFNIWPAEVENAIADHPAVKEVAVVGVPHPKWGETPRAVVVLREGAHATEEEIIAWCRDRTGSMKKPTSVVFRDEPLPKSAVGKLLRRVVREQEWPKQPGGAPTPLISGA
jgi:acyl-CoA synthetase (AMP-forming)/AMP-acid ligase II